MKDPNKELQSRRKFFKKIVTHSLPILGCIFASSLPFTIDSKEQTYCTDQTCKYSCTGCTSSCKVGCGYGCMSGCYGCRESCEGQCITSCYNGCLQSCYGTCKGGCAKQAYA